MTFFSTTIWVSRHQKGKPFWILLEQEMMGWQWHQLDHMQISDEYYDTDFAFSVLQIQQKHSWLYF